MENPIKNAAGENGGTAGTKIERLQLRARCLQQQAQQARERLREEESAQEKLTRLMERRRIETEQRLLGGLAYIAGLGSFRTRSMVQRSTTCRWMRIYSLAPCGNCTSNLGPLMTGLNFRISGRTAQVCARPITRTGKTQVPHSSC